MAAPPPSPPSPATPLPLRSPASFSASSPRLPYGTPHVTVKTELAAPSNAKEKSPRDPSSASIPTSIAVPSHSRWFSFGEIHATERRMLPEFFDGKSGAKNPNLYKYYRDFIIRRFRENPSRKITFTEVRRTLVGDVGSVRRVFDFLETWGLINYSGSEKQGSKVGIDEKEKRGIENGFSNRKSFCSTCKSECNIVCFATEKVPDLVLCARCFVRGSFRGGLTHADFKRIDVSGISEQKRDWSDKDVLHLLEALLLYGDDWKKVAEHVGGGKSEKDCVLRFIRLPFAEQFMDHHHHQDDHALKMSLSPLADASNPIVSQVAFLANIAGSDVVEAASKAAIAALGEGNLVNSHLENAGDSGAADSNPDEDGMVSSIEEQESKDRSRAIKEAKILLEREEQELEESLSQIVGSQMKGMLEKIIHFEDLELLLEREWLQLQHLRNLLFVDQLNFLQQRSISKSEDNAEKKMAVETLGKE